MTLPGVACLVPAFNEADRIGPVLAAVLQNRLVDEVIVIDDASQDGTAEVARAAGARVLRQPVNGGKSAAIAAGIAATRAPLLMLLDADLQGLRSDHLTALLAPVLMAEAEASLSLRANAPWAWRLAGIDYISGERVVPRAMLAHRLDEIAALPRFGLEVWLNARWIAAGTRLAVVDLPGVASPAKAAKRGLARGLLADAAMMADIFRTIPPHRALHQIRALRRQAGLPGPWADGRRSLPLRHQFFWG